MPNWIDKTQKSKYNIKEQTSSENFSLLVKIFVVESADKKRY